MSPEPGCGVTLPAAWLVNATTTAFFLAVPIYDPSEAYRSFRTDRRFTLLRVIACLTEQAWRHY